MDIATEKNKRLIAIPIILLICMIALGIVFSIFFYQQNAETGKHVDVISNPDVGIVPADGT